MRWYKVTFTISNMTSTQLFFTSEDRIKESILELYGVDPIQLSVINIKKFEIEEISY